MESRIMFGLQELLLLPPLIYGDNRQIGIYLVFLTVHISKLHNEVNAK